jgi:hypothetical protein
MKDSDVDAWLKGARGIPERATEYWDTFSPRVIAQLRTPGEQDRPTGTRWRVLLAAQIALAVVILAFGFLLGRRQEEAAGARASLRSERLLREVQAFFPKRVRAIVADEKGVHLILSDLPDIPATRPVWVEIEARGLRRTAVTFDGQVLPIADDAVRVRIDPHGDLTLAGHHVSWSSREPDKVTSGWHIRAEVLPFTL